MHQSQQALQEIAAAAPTSSATSVCIAFVHASLAQNPGALLAAAEEWDMEHTNEVVPHAALFAVTNSICRQLGAEAAKGQAGVEEMARTLAVYLFSLDTSKTGVPVALTVADKHPK